MLILAVSVSCLVEAKDYGSAIINSIPPGAEVYINDELLGRTPFLVLPSEYILSAGRYVIKIYKEGYEPWLGIVNITPSTTEIVDAYLKKLGDVELMRGDLVMNSGFEMDLDHDGMPDHWTIVADNKDEVQAELELGGAQGLYSLRLISVDSNEVKLQGDYITCIPKMIYLISAYAKTQGAGARISVSFLDRDGEPIPEEGGLLIPPVTDKFTLYYHTFTVPSTAYSMAPHLISSGGIIWWDAVQIVALGQMAPSKLSNLIPNPGFSIDKSTIGIPGGWTPTEYEGVTLSLDGKIFFLKAPSLKVVNSREDEISVVKDLDCDPRSAHALTLYAMTSDDCSARVSIVFKDKDGNILGSEEGELAFVINPSQPDFVKYAHSFITPPECATLSINLVVPPGVAWWDNIYLFKRE